MSTKEFCVVCGEDRSLRHETQQVEYTVRGEPIKLDLSVVVCSDCGMVLKEGQVDVVDLAFQEYRLRKGILTPSEIREIRKKYQLSQRSFAALLGMSEATINRYEGGGLQDEAHDQAIRSCMAPGVMNDLLKRRGDRLSEWQRGRVNAVLKVQAGCELDNRWRMPEELTLQTGFRQFQYEKYAVVVVWLCKKLSHITTTSLNKLLFYADFLCYKSESVSLTGSAYRQMQFGPVPVNYDGLKTQMKRDEIIDTIEKIYQNGHGGEEFSLGPMAEKFSGFNEAFSTRELAVLEAVASAFKDATPGEISDRSHKESAWRDTPEREIISYKLAENLSLSVPL